jgi:hypothetical protein
MEDFERYADYDERDYDEKRKSGAFILILKICVAVLCIGVVSILAFRIAIFRNSPETMKKLYFTDTLTEFYNENSGNIEILTQELRVPYDNSKFANFFCDNLFVIKAAGELQISLRYNESMLAEAEKKYSISNLDFDDENLLTVRLYDNNGKIYTNLIYSATENHYMYQYQKLCFGGIDFDNAEWIRLEIFITEANSDEPFAKVPIYENHADFNLFDKYVIKEGEIPKNDK